MRECVLTCGLGFLGASSVLCRLLVEHESAKDMADGIDKECAVRLSEGGMFSKVPEIGIRGRRIGLIYMYESDVLWEDISNF